MIAYKGMEPGMICLGYQLKIGLNVTEQALSLIHISEPTRPY